MNERELKDKVEVFRREISKYNKEIQGIVREMRVHQKEASKLKSLRDESNEKCKNLSQKAKELRDKRDELNMKIASMKDERGKLSGKVKSLSGDIKQSKERRDELNKAAHGTGKALSKKYEKTLNALLTEDIPLSQEKRFFESIFKIRERLAAAEKANVLHQKVVETYEGLKEVDTEIDGISSGIRALADESEKFHKEAIQVYRSLDEIRKKGDSYHKQLLEKYALIDPLRDTITDLREKIKGVEEKMSPFASELDGIKAEKEAERKTQKASEAKQKLKSSKRISFNDFKAIMEVDGLDESEKPSGS